MSRPDANHEIVLVPPPGHPARPALLQQCLALRIAVFVDEQRFPLATEIDQHEDTATHLLLRLLPSLTPAGTVRATRLGHPVPGDAPRYKLSRLAVLAPHRRRHLGAALVRALHAWVVEDSPAPHVVVVVAHAQIPAIPFYARLGYRPQGDRFDEDGAPHQRMLAHLPDSD